MLTDTQRRQACTHEAAHAVVALHFGQDVERVQAWGFSDGNDTRYFIRDCSDEDSATISAAGIVVHGFAGGANSDIDSVLKFALGSDYERCTHSQQRQAITKHKDRAQKIMFDNTPLLDAMSKRLFSQCILGRLDIIELQREHNRSLN